jgi:hypothetical protein
MESTPEIKEVKQNEVKIPEVKEQPKLEPDWLDLLIDLESDLDKSAKTQAELLWRQAYKQQSDEATKLQNQLQQLRQEQKEVCPETWNLEKSGAAMEACLLKIAQDRLELKQRLLMKKRWLKMNKDEEQLQILRKEQTESDPTNPLAIEHKTFTVKVIKVMLDIVGNVSMRENKKVVANGIFDILLLYPHLVKNHPTFAKVMRAKSIEFIEQDNLSGARKAYPVFFDVEAEDYKEALRKWD